MKNFVRASLVVLALAGVYAGITAPAPAMDQPHPAITVAEGSSPTPTTPTYPTSPTSPTNPKSSTL